MGTYIYARLKDKSEQGILKANKSIEKAGWKSETHNGVLYGFFTSRTQLAEDARFMNEDPEGLKQAPHWERPVTIEQLEQLFWNEVGCGAIKISGCDDERQKDVDLVVRWLRSKDGKQMIDFETSENIIDFAPNLRPYKIYMFNAANGLEYMGKVEATKKRYALSKFMSESGLKFSSRHDFLIIGEQTFKKAKFEFYPTVKNRQTKSGTMEVKVEYLDENITVTGYYHEGCAGDYDTPPVSSYFEAEKIIYRGVDIYPIIHADDQTHIEDLCLSKIEDN